ncbi:hypothetical protein [Shinella sp. G-2]|uniref:hypothetical protein n=1 Tax=Shinella sp. G-2 TaxID=3133141 RepID=UPI003CFE46B6
MTRKRDPFTVDLFSDLKPAPVVDRFDGEDVKAWSLAGRLAKAVARTMEASGKSRDEIAAEMTEVTKTDVSKAMLDAYASQAREKHSISALRLAALAIVTGDARAFNTLLEEAGLIVVPQKYEALLRRERARELRDQLEREEKAADAEWRANR